jgi:hypothetical protein
MNSSPGYTILELAIAIGVMTICLSFIIPVIVPISSQLSKFRNKIRQQTHLNWLADQVCDDIQWSGPATLIGHTIHITAVPIIQYEYNGTSLRRRLGGSMQPLSTFPITDWTVTHTGSQLSFHIETATASVNRTCHPW